MNIPLSISLHIGAHRTASTHFQQLVECNSAALEQSGIMAHTPSSLRGEGKPLWDKLTSKQIASQEEQESLIKQLSKSYSQLVLSEENTLGSMFSSSGGMTSSLYPNGHVKVAIFLKNTPNCSTTTYIAIRNPATYLPSVYAYGLTRGRYMSFDGFMGKVSPFALKWSDLVSRVRQLRNTRNVVIWKHEDYTLREFDIFGEVTTLSTRNLIRPKNPNIHSSIPLEAITELSRIGWDHLSREVVEKTRKRFLPLRDYGRFQPFTDNQVDKLNMAYDEDCEAIGKIPGVVFI